MSYKVGDKFIIEIAEEFSGKCWCEFPDLLYRIKGFNSLVFDENGLDKLEKYKEKPFAQEDCDMARSEGYQEGLNDAWEAANKLNRMNIDDVRKALGNIERENIFDGSSAEAISKIKAYEEQKKAEEGIKVGDELTYTTIDEPFVYLGKFDSDNPCVHKAFGRYSFEKYQFAGLTGLSKTGRHYDIEGILKAMREE